MPALWTAYGGKWFEALGRSPLLRDTVDLPLHAFPHQYRSKGTCMDQRRLHRSIIAAGARP